MTEAHNVVRARLMNPKPEPALPPLKWSNEIAEIAQAYADKLASGGPDCLMRMAHSNRPGYGENLAGYSGYKSTSKEVTEGWASEEQCWTFGPISRENTDCDVACAMRESSSASCGHFTQVAWRGTTEVGCGVATCDSRLGGDELWVCNYREPGNFIGMEPY
jgi:pathogenesis-related protein 1